jgi:titin
VDLVTLPADSVSYTDASVTTGKVYEYQVAARNSVGTSAFAGPVAVDLTSAPPAAPTNLTAGVLGATQVGLSWTDNATNETGFVVQRSVGGGAFVDLVTLPADSVSYTDGAVAAPNTYSYRVMATNGVGSSAPSNVASVSVTVPPAPTNLSAANITRTSFTLNWQYNGTAPDGFEVQVSTKSNFSTLVQIFPDVAADQTSLAITGLTRNTQYYVRIRGFNAVGAGPWSAVLSVRTTK